MSKNTINPLQVSLREVLAVTVFIAAGIASMRASGLVASLMILATVIVILVIAIRAAVATGHQRAFGLGFLIPVLGYLALTGLFGEDEFKAKYGTLPTTRALQHFVPPRSSDGIAGSLLGARSENAKTFMPLGHLLIAMVGGYCGGKYAIWVYRSNNRLA